MKSCPPGGVRMFDEPAIGPEDIAWIQRDLYVYYVEMARHLGDPTDWVAFQSDLAEALDAAFGLKAREDRRLISTG